MAGDWIKVEHVLPDKPEIDQIARILNIDHDSVVGKLLRVWVWADQNTISGNAVTVTFAFFDRITFCNGFSSALVRVGWLRESGDMLEFPNFDRHNGQTAKDRAVTNRRVAKSRAACNADTVTNVTLAPLQKPLPEKRREEYTNTDSLHESSAHVEIPSDEVKQKKEPKPKQTPEEFLESLKANPAYSHIDFSKEMGRIDAWLMVNQGRQKTPKFVVNWLNRIQAPLAKGNGTKPAGSGLGTTIKPGDKW